jgi:hypothetical protein
MRGATHLLMVRLFFLDPNKPCIKMIGDVCLSVMGFTGSCKSYASETVENGDEACMRAARHLPDAGPDAETGTRTRPVHPEYACRKAEVDGLKPIMAVYCLELNECIPNANPNESFK